MKKITRFLCLGVCLGLMSTSVLALEHADLPQPLSLSWQAPEQLDHPLLGQIWQTEAAQAVPFNHFLEALKPGEWLLLGEQHDHPDHHQLQVLLLTRLAEQKRLGTVAFEMANSTQQADLDTWLHQDQAVSAEALNWSPGWPWSRYQQQVQLALHSATRVIGADLPREQQRKAYQQGAPQGLLDDAHTQFMMELVFESHCALLPREHLIDMIQVQLARDQHMAEQLDASTDPHKINVLIAGALHVRKDIGIPRWLNRAHHSVIFRALQTAQHPQDYVDATYPGYPLPGLSSDYLIFTPQLPERDYCAELRAGVQGDER